MVKQARQESVPNGHGTVFKIGDGVHWGFNGDAYPGTVRKVSNSGRQVWVSSDDHVATDKEREYVKQHGIHDGPIDSVFTPKDVPESEWTCYTLNKWGDFKPKGHPGRSGAWSLQPGRLYCQNPCF